MVPARDTARRYARDTARRQSRKNLGQASITHSGSQDVRPVGVSLDSALARLGWVKASLLRDDQALATAQDKVAATQTLLGEAAQRMARTAAATEPLNPDDMETQPFPPNLAALLFLIEQAERDMAADAPAGTEWITKLRSGLCGPRHRGPPHGVKVRFGQGATLPAGDDLEQEDFRALRRQLQDCADRARVPLSEPDDGYMSLDDAAPQAATAPVAAALPSITHRGFNCVTARIHVDQTCQRTDGTSTSLTTSEIRVVVISPCIPSFAAGLVRAGYTYRHSSDTVNSGPVNVVAPRHAFPRGLVNLW